MKIPAHFLALILSSFFTAALPAETGTVKILGVGNSFTINATNHLPQVYADSPVSADIGVAYIGGCSLERHVAHAKEHEADPGTGKEYAYRMNGENVEGRKFALKEILLAEEWDYITIQQVSRESYRKESFYPYAQELIEYIRRYRPGAELVVHETWSHSINSDRYKKQGIDPDEMYARLHANYARIGEEHGLRIIPVGTAFQRARATEMWDLQPDGFDSQNHGLTYPADKNNLPGMSRSLTSDYAWKKDKDGRWRVGSDGYHANTNGEYLAALVWYGFFTGNDIRKIAYAPGGMSTAQAESLRTVAHRTISTETPRAAKESPTDVPTGIPAILCADQADNRIRLVDPLAPDGEGLLWCYPPETEEPPSFRPTDAKRVEFRGEVHILAAYHGRVRLVRFADRAVVKDFGTPSSCHSAELLPDGALVTANSNHGILRLHRSEDDFVDLELPYAHGVVWDKERGRLWVLGDLLYRFRYSGKELSPDGTFEMPLSPTGHDLFPLRDGTKLLASNNDALFLFDIGTEKFEIISRMERIKSASQNTDGTIWVSEPKVIEGAREWQSDALIPVIPQDPAISHIVNGARFYKARWWQEVKFSY